MTKPGPVFGNRGTHRMFAFAYVVVAFVIASMGGGIDEVLGFSIAKTTTTTAAIRCRVTKSSMSTSFAADMKTTGRIATIVSMSSSADDVPYDESVHDGNRRSLLASSTHSSIALLLATTTTSISSAMAGSL